MRSCSRAPSWPRRERAPHHTPLCRPGRGSSLETKPPDTLMSDRSPESLGLSCLDGGILSRQVEHPPRWGLPCSDFSSLPAGPSSWDDLGRQMLKTAGPPSAWGPEGTRGQGPFPITRAPVGCSRRGPHEDKKGAPVLPSPSGVRMCFCSSWRRLSRECSSRSLPAWAQSRKPVPQPWF